MTATVTRDIVDLLYEDHQHIRRMLATMTSASPEERAAIFEWFMPFLARHEIAEEIVVYPVISSRAPFDSVGLEPWLKEQGDAAAQLAKMERSDPTSDGFAAQLACLRVTLLAHAYVEEQRLFPLLRELDDPGLRARLATRYENAKAEAPIQTQPIAPAKAAHRVLAPFIALIDKISDVVGASPPVADRRYGAGPLLGNPGRPWS